MAYPHLHFPALRSEHLAGAALHADRTDLIRSLNLPPGAAIAEVGVAMGDFSEFLLQTVAPSRFVAIDTFTMHEAPAHWGTPSATLFDNKTHLGFYRDRFASRGSQVQVMPGWSHVALAELADASFDLIYLDAGHDYDSVRQDAGVAASKLRPDGFLVFNDYIMFDHMSGTPYGVVPVVNELVVSGAWRVVGLALQQHMFCDIALRRVRA